MKTFFDLFLLPACIQSSSYCNMNLIVILSLVNLYHCLHIVLQLLLVLYLKCFIYVVYLSNYIGLCTLSESNILHSLQALRLDVRVLCLCVLYFAIIIPLWK